jgi:hypothetical protein
MTDRTQQREPPADYRTHNPKGYMGDPKRGAALGRPTIWGPRNYDGKLMLRRISLDHQGYDRLGTYFGAGQPIFWYASDDGTIDGTVRAWGRDSAKQEINKLYPCASFYR